MKSTMRGVVAGCTFALIATMAIGQTPGSLRSGETRTSQSTLLHQQTLDLGGGTIIRFGDGGYAISLDNGGTWHDTPQTSYELKLRYRNFDPLLGAPAVPIHLRPTQPGDEARPYIVQFHTQPLEEYRRDIRALGGVIYNYLAHHSYIVMMTPAERDLVAALEYVRWTGEFQPAYKLEEYLLDNLGDPQSDLAAARYHVQVFERGMAMQNQIADLVVAMGGRVDLTVPESFIMDATLTGQQVLELARQPQVLWIDRWSPPEDDMNIARDFGGGNYVESVGGYTGEGVRAEVMDGNLMTSHGDFQHHPPIIHGNTSGSSSHGTNTYGIIFGDGSGDSTARGMMPDAQGIFADYGQFTNRYQHTAQLVQSPYFAVFQSNSWGSNRTTEYTSDSTMMDDIIFDLDIIICQSQSNAGNQQSRPQAWAKNIVAVGGIRHQNTLTRADDSWSGGASIGPAADDRIKPDLAHFYDNIRTTSNSGGYTSSFGGTSGATPITAGHFGLFFEMWSDGIFGNQVDGQGTVFANRPHFSTAKAVMINTADPWDFSGTSHDLTRTHQGWGAADLKELYDNREKLFIIDESRVLTNLETATYELTVPSGEPQIRATLVYPDPPGTTNSNLHRINDLTLKVTSPGGTVYWGNNGLRSGNWSTSGGSANTIDTVENVFVQNPAAGVWTVEVIASQVNQDSHVETPATDADFALVVQGVNPPSSVASLDDVTIISGTLAAGGLAQLQNSDDDTFDVFSILGFSAQEPNRLRVHVGLTSPSATAGTLDVLIEGRIDNPGGIGRLGLRNWATGTFIVFDSYPLTQNETVHVVAGVDATDRIRGSDSRIELMYIQTVIATFSASGFTSFTDFIEVGVD